MQRASNASIWVIFISKNSDTLEIADDCLLNTPIIICRYGFNSGQIISLINLIQRSLGQFVNHPSIKTLL